MTTINEQFLNNNASSKVSSTSTLYTIRNYGTFMPVTHEFIMENLEKTLGIETLSHYCAKILMAKADKPSYFINVTKQDEQMMGELNCWLDRDTNTYKIEGYHMEEDHEAQMMATHAEEGNTESAMTPMKTITVERTDCSVSPDSNTVDNVLKYMISLID